MEFYMTEMRSLDTFTLYFQISWTNSVKVFFGRRTTQRRARKQQVLYMAGLAGRDGPCQVPAVNLQGRQTIP